MVTTGLELVVVLTGTWACVKMETIKKTASAVFFIK
jgi:hypothetical protein